MLSAATEMDKFTLNKNIFCGSLLDWAARGVTLTKQHKTIKKAKFLLFYLSRDLVIE